MKQLLKSAFSVRRALIRQGKSFLDSEWTEKEMQRIEYWLANGSNAINTARKNADVLRVILTPNFIQRFEKLLKTE